MTFTRRKLLTGCVAAVAILLGPVACGTSNDTSSDASTAQKATVSPSQQPATSAAPDAAAKVADLKVEILTVKAGQIDSLGAVITCGAGYTPVQLVIPTQAVLLNVQPTLTRVSATVVEIEAGGQVVSIVNKIKGISLTDGVASVIYTMLQMKATDTAKTPWATPTGICVTNGTTSPAVVPIG